MKISSPLSSAAVSAALALAALSCHAESHEAPHWGYAGKAGPSHWSAIDEGFKACSLGHHQSPVDIRKTVAADLPALDFQYGEVTPTFVNNGHTIQVVVPPGQFLIVNGERLELLQFHFHTPSEEHVNGKSFPISAHLVHRAPDGKLGVVGVLLQAGKPSAYDVLFDHLPAKAGESLSVANLVLKMSDLIPKDQRYYDYQGSLTTPPCSEEVHWMVMQKPMTVSAAHVQAFRKLYHMNARPVQPLGDRVVQSSR